MLFSLHFPFRVLALGTAVLLLNFDPILMRRQYLVSRKSKNELFISAMKEELLFHIKGFTITLRKLGMRERIAESNCDFSQSTVSTLLSVQHSIV